MAKVTHYEKENGDILCNTKGKSIKKSFDKNVVTCKRCLKKLNECDSDILKIADLDTLCYYVNSGKIEIVNHNNGKYSVKSKDNKNVTVDPHVMRIIEDTDIQGAF